MVQKNDRFFIVRCRFSIRFPLSYPNLGFLGAKDTMFPDRGNVKRTTDN